jgi:hypothetical protein
VPVTRASANKWLMRAERLAGLPHQRGGLWHAYRRLWAVERQHLADHDVAAAGGWGNTAALKQSYQRSTTAGRRAASRAVGT